MDSIGTPVCVFVCICLSVYLSFCVCVLCLKNSPGLRLNLSCLFRTIFPFKTGRGVTMRKNHLGYWLDQFSPLMTLNDLLCSSPPKCYILQGDWVHPMDYKSIMFGSLSFKSGLLRKIKDAYQSSFWNTHTLSSSSWKIVKKDVSIFLDDIIIWEKKY